MQMFSSFDFVLMTIQGQTWSIHALETTFLLAVERLPLDVACKVYVRLHALSTVPRQVDVVDDADINEV